MPDHVTSDHTVVIKTALGEYEGALVDGVASFKGIPYALPPFGSRRFRAPAPVPAHDGVRRCLEYGPTVPKGLYPEPIDTLLPEPAIEGNDCLNLNVWTPDPGARGLPVLVWIHGGAFVHGSGAVGGYDGTAFARDGVVCVTINYRLGVDGFLVLDGIPANRGLLDQVAALEWVRDHIAAFGGDPSRVTVAGESAGAMSIGALLAMPKAEGLFQQAILQSGAAVHVLTEPTSRKVSAELAKLLGIEATAEAFAGLPLAELIAGQDRFAAGLLLDRDPVKWGELVLNSMPFEPTVDGEVLPAAPMERIRAGAGSGVRLLIGTNREEMTLFLVATGLLDVTDEAIAVFTAAAYGLPGDGVAAYRETRPEASVGDLIVDVTTDWVFRIPALRLVEARGDGAEPSFVYEFGWRTPQWDGRLGSTHALEIAFTFDNLGGPGGEPLLGLNPPQDLADTMHAAWVAFIAAGDPGWRPYRADREVMIFDADTSTGTSSGVRADPRARTRLVWDGIR